jgi:membrane protein YqaA with SNARE-associated domain
VSIKLIFSKPSVFTSAIFTSLFITISLLFFSPKIAGFFLYILIACTFIPLPTPQVVILYGGEFSPLFVAVVGGVATCISGLINYGITAYLLSKNIAKPIKDSRLFRFSTRMFERAPFVSLVIAGFSPIPFDPFMFLSAAVCYSYTKYLLAIFVGRTPRYFLLAYLGERFYIPTPILIATIVVWIAIILIKGRK